MNDLIKSVLHRADESYIMHQLPPSSGMGSSWQPQQSNEADRHPVLGTVFLFMGVIGFFMVVAAAILFIERPTLLRGFSSALIWADVAVALATKTCLVTIGVLLLGRFPMAANMLLVAAALSAADSALGWLMPQPVVKYSVLSPETADRIRLASHLLAFVPAIAYLCVFGYLKLPSAKSPGYVPDASA